MNLILSLIFAAHAGQIPSMTREPATAPRELCTWDITFHHRLGEYHQGKSKHAWLLTKKEQIDMFGPFVDGAEIVWPGSWYDCGGKKVTLGSPALIRRKK